MTNRLRARQVWRHGMSSDRLALDWSVSAMPSHGGPCQVEVQVGDHAMLLDADATHELMAGLLNASWHVAKENARVNDWTDGDKR